MSGATILLKFPAAGSITPLDIAEELGTKFAKTVGCPSEGTVACLRRLTTQQILTVEAPYMLSQPAVDGKFLPTTPAEAFKSGHFNHVSLINGSTLDESTFFVGTRENKSGAALSAAAYSVAIRDFYHGALAEQVLQQYPPERYNTPSDAMAAAVTASEFACPARALDLWLAGKTPVYAYEFADRTAPSYLKPTTFPMGAMHTGELPYIFLGFHGGAGVPVTLNPLQEKLAYQIVKYWSQAAKAPAREAEWPRYDVTQDNFMSLLLPAGRMTSHTFSDTHNCAFWDQTGIY
jgi:para-nitrobenzyl esterase